MSYLDRRMYRRQMRGRACQRIYSLRVAGLMGGKAALTLSVAYTPVSDFIKSNCFHLFTRPGGVFLKIRGG